MLVRGSKFTATIDTTTNHDISFSEAREIQGLWFEVVNHGPDDYAEFFACLPDGTPVVQFSETSYIPPSGIVRPIISERGDVLPQGFKLRMKYVCAKTSGDAPVVYLYYRMRK